MKEERNIPFKNYIILSLVLLLSVIGVVYFYMWYNEFETTAVNTPVMDKYLNVINYNEFDDYLVDIKNTVVYISELGDVETREFENKFKNSIDNYSLNEIMVYLNLTEEKKDNNLYSNIKNKYQIGDLPSIVIFKNGNVDDVYSIKNNDYDIDLLISYLKIEGVIND